MDSEPSRKGPKAKNLAQSVEIVPIFLGVWGRYLQGLRLGDLVTRCRFVQEGRSPPIVSSNRIRFCTLQSS